MMSRHTLGEFVLIGIIASAVQFLGQYLFSQILPFPALAIFFGYKPGNTPARVATA